MAGAGGIAGFVAGGATDAGSSHDISTAPTKPSTGSFALASASTVAIPASENPIVAGARGSLVTADSAPKTSAAPADAIPPAATVAMRFPTVWNTVDSSTAPAARVAHGGGAAQRLPPGLIFAPTVAPPSAEAEDARPTSSGQVLAFAHPGDEAVHRGAVANSSAPKENAAPPAEKRGAKPKPAASQPRTLFNDAQLAALKARLKLTENQEQHWPAVEQALRAIEWRRSSRHASKKTVHSTRAQSIDPSSPEVQQLKSAAIPLIMSMREEQKREVRMLAHTMGLSQVAAQF